MITLLGAELVLTHCCRGYERFCSHKRRMTLRMKLRIVTWSDNLIIQLTRKHRNTTAEEIWANTAGGADILISAVGTGTITGVAQILKKYKPIFKAVAVEPSASPVAYRLVNQRHTKFRELVRLYPHVLDLGIIDEIIQVSDDEIFLQWHEVARQKVFLLVFHLGAL